MQFDNFIIKLNHRATISNYFPLIWKIVHRTVTVHKTSAKHHVYPVKRIIKLFLRLICLLESPRVTVKDPVSGGPGWPDEWIPGRKIEIRKKTQLGERRNDKGRRTERGSSRCFWTQASWPTVGSASILFSSEGFKKITFKLASHRWEADPRSEQVGQCFCF